MGRPTIQGLTRVYNARSPDPINAEPHIETAVEARHEDITRCSVIRRMSREASLINRGRKRLNAAIALSHRIESNCFTQASAVQMREWRLAAVEQVWQLVVKAGPENCATWSAIVPSWVLTHEQLEATRASHLTERFRALLNRNGAAKADGWLVAKLDDEFDLRNQLHRLHLHGAVCGEMINVLDSLRNSALLRPKRSPAIDGCRVIRPLHIDRRPLTNLPMPLSYVLKGHFSARWLGLGSDGTVKRGRHPCRIPEPFGIRTLMWLDRQKLADMFVTFGLTVRDRQLVTRH